MLLPKASSAHWLYPLCLSQASSVLLHTINALSPTFRCVFVTALKDSQTSEGFLMVDSKEGIH